MRVPRIVRNVLPKQRFIATALIGFTIATAFADHVAANDLVTTLNEHWAKRASEQFEPWDFEFEARVGFAAAGFMHLQQAELPLFVDVVEELREVSRGLEVGALVRVSGSVGLSKRNVVTSIEVVEAKGRIEAVPLKIGDGKGSTRSFTYCFVEGRVRQAVRQAGKTMLSLGVDGADVRVEITEVTPPEKILSWLQRNIRIEGTLRSPKESYPSLLVRSVSQVRIVNANVLNSVTSVVSNLPCFENAAVLFSDHASKIIVEHDSVEGPIVLRSHYADRFDFGDSVSVHAERLHPRQYMGRIDPRFRARLIEDHGVTKQIDVTQVSRLAEIQPLSCPPQGLVEIVGTLIVQKRGHMMVEAPDGIFIAHVDSLDLPADKRGLQGSQVRITGVPIWEPASSGSRLDGDPQPELKLIVPKADYVTIESMPVRISHDWLVALFGLIGTVALGVIMWNRSLRNQVQSRTEHMDTISGHLATSFEAVREAILLSDERDTVVRANSRFEDFFGFRPDIGSPMEECIERLAQSFDDADKFRLFCGKETARGQLVESELPMSGKSMQVYCNEVHDLHHRPIGRLLAFYDCTRQRQLEQELLQSQKMEAIGQISAGVAHDFNNLLTVISSNATVLSSEAKRAGLEVSGLSAPIDSAVGRAADLTRQMLDFSRNAQLDVRPVDINLLVQEVYDLARRTIDASVALNLFMHTEPLVVNADSTRVVQVLLNLCINARDAIPAGHGVIRIRTRPELADASHPTACIEVQDDGIGMTEEVRQRIFDPFFTTKPRSSGTGLGLSTAIGIIKQHGGEIECQSEVSKGTTFRVYLPLDTDPEPRVASVPAQSSHTSSSGLHLLLVDDEDMLRRSGKSVLESLGHEVTTAIDGIDALLLIEKLGTFDAVLMDLTMPRMSGHEACKAIRNRWTDLPVIICSGYSMTRLDPAHETDSRVSFLAKPFRLDELEEVIQQVTTPPSKQIKS